MADQDKTALQLAEAIVERLLFEGDPPVAQKSYVSAGAAEVLDILRDNGVWFCRLSETPQGTKQERLPVGGRDG